MRLHRAIVAAVIVLAASPALASAASLTARADVFARHYAWRVNNIPPSEQPYMTARCTGTAKLLDCAIFAPQNGQPGAPVQIVGYVQLKYTHGKFHVWRSTVDSGGI